MKKAEWLTCENPNHALDLLRAVGNRSRRKSRLAAAAALRCFWDDLSDQQRRAVTAAERYADGDLQVAELREATVLPGNDATWGLPSAVAWVTHREAARALWNATALFLPVVTSGPIYTNPPFPDGRAYAEQGRPMLAILRCIFDNLFRPVTFLTGWQTATAVSLAQTIYAERAFDRLPVLADALEDAGCTDRVILDHCRQPGEHVRGCWVVDLVLGKV